MSDYWKARRVIVTGASGFIGSQLVNDLIAKKADVVGIINSVRNKNNDIEGRDLNKLKGPPDFIRVDLTKNIIDPEVFKENCIIFHTAAVDGGREYKIKHYKKLYNSNIKILKNCLKSIPPKLNLKFVYLSSADVYYKSQYQKDLKEEDMQTMKPDNKLGYYAWSKIQCEKTLKNFARKSNIDVLIVRPANIFGTGDLVSKQRLVPVVLDKLKDKGKILDIQVTNDIRCFTYLPDFTANLLELTEYAKKGTYNLSAAFPISIKDFISLFAKYAGKVLINNKNSEMPSKATILNVDRARNIIHNWRETPYDTSVRNIIGNFFS